MGKWHQAVKLGKGTKDLLKKWKTNSATFDLSTSHDRETTEEPMIPLKKAENSVMEKDTKKSTWSEHVWSTFIHRGYSDEVTDKEDKPHGGELLTDFQRDKFKYFFYHVLDLNTDHVISEEDFIKLDDRIKHYMDWSVNTVQFLAIQEVHAALLDSFLSTSADITANKNHGEWDSIPPNREPEVTEQNIWLFILFFLIFRFI